ncbi:hypothetical protein L9F63_003976, partial [Diploptera punctata]
FWTRFNLNLNTCYIEIYTILDDWNRLLYLPIVLLPYSSSSRHTIVVLLLPLFLLLVPIHDTPMNFSLNVSEFVRYLNSFIGSMVFPFITILVLLG